MHGRRALLYRAGRWLERAGAALDALDALEQAFAIAPSEGAMLLALERLARCANKPEVLVRALRRLADNAGTARDKVRLLRRAAQVCEDDCSAPEEALASYELALRTLPDTETEERALACLARLKGEAAEVARERLIALFREQAQEAWATTPRVQALLSRGRLELDRESGEEAERVLAEAKAASRQTPSCQKTSGPH